MSLQTHTGYQTPLQSDVSLHSAPMAANHSASPGCTPSALVWVTLATTCRLALTLGRAPSHPLHHSPVLKQLLPRGSWHGTAEHSCGATAHVRAHEARTQHKPLPWFSGRSHFQDILNTVLTSTWPTLIKMFAGYVDQHRELTALRNKICCSLSLLYLKDSWIIYFIRNEGFTLWLCLANDKK